MQTALEATELYVQKRAISSKSSGGTYKRLACHLVEAVAKVLALRLRYT
ncbi:MAG: hypothetical protein IPJ27_00010 [Candidatus Accumulibacter sp.]|uniref:Uncharacterized protein n=1 Tax=Candidatus Accumulibacter proximus TaxID=2954385 RepID=A0A935PVK5_9PROT|nr:hypothetical protein [Candidatus Accumulibacter proximus]